MYHLFGELVNDLCTQKRHTPLALQTTATMQAEATHNDALDHAIGWCVYADEFLRRAAERNTRVAHRDFCRQHKADQAARNLWRKDHGFDRDPATAIAIDTRGFAADAQEARPAPRVGVVTVYDATGGRIKRRRLIDFATGLEATATPATTERAAPRHSRAFPKLEPVAVPLPGAEYEDYAPVEPTAFLVPIEEDAINYRELRGKAFLTASERVGDYDPGEGCPHCHRGPALCNCDLFAPEEEDVPALEAGIERATNTLNALPEDARDERKRLAEHVGALKRRLLAIEPGYAGLESDDVDYYINLDGTKLEAEGILAEARAMQAQASAAIAALEADRRTPKSPEERERLAAIERLTHQLIAAEGAERQQGRRVVELADQLLALELAA